MPSSLSLALSYIRNNSTSDTQKQGIALIETAASLTNWDRVAHYAQSLETDEEYQTTLERMRLCVNSGEAKYLYVMMPYEGKCLFIYDTDETDGHLSLGETIEWEEMFEDKGDELSKGSTVEPFIAKDADEELFTICIPFTDSSGNFVAYMGVDYSLDFIVNEEWAFVGQLIAVTVFIAFVMTMILLALLRTVVVAPIGNIAQAANSYLDDGESEISDTNTLTELNIKTHDELQNLSESLKRMERKLREYVVHLEEVTLKAETDLMTGHLNREAFERRVEKALLDKKLEGYLVFMMIDLDWFKDINDTFGHQVGDEVLIGCADAIKSCFRESDYVSRVGGDEFAVFFTCPASLAEVDRRASQLCETIRALEFSDGAKITISIGVTVISSFESVSYQELYIASDALLYTVKERGRNGYLIQEGIGGDVHE